MAKSFEQVFQEPAKLPKVKSVPGVDAVTFLMEILGLFMFLIGFAAFVFLIFIGLMVAKDTSSPGLVAASVSFIGFFSTFGIMLSGSIMYLLARINHRLWTT
jgi:uncharacterized RDD family membrane protein YckC